MFIKFEQYNEIVCIKRSKIYGYVIDRDGSIKLFVAGTFEDNVFIVDLYHGNKKLADKIMSDAMASSDYIVELPTMERVKEYFNGKNKDSESNK